MKVSGEWKPLNMAPAEQLSEPVTRLDLNLPAAQGWGKSAAEFTLTPAGVAGAAPLPSFLYSPKKAELRTTPRFHINAATPT